VAKSSRHFYTLSSDGSVQEAYGLGIREARAAKAFISPTTITEEIRATPFHLKRWQRQQLVNACVDAPIVPGETTENYYDRVNDLSFRKSDAATTFGNKLHELAKHFPLQPTDVTLGPWYTYFKEWYDQNVREDLGVEERIADPDIGVAGTLDRRVVLHDGRLCIVDFKTQGIKDRVYFGDSWPKQLGFYANATRKKYHEPETPACMNVVIDSTIPAPLIIKEWSKTEIEEAYKDFMCEAWLWSRDNTHWPCGKWNLNLAA
jgi:hypothetical protein